MGFKNHLGVYIERTVYVDVDGTLLIWPGPRPGRVPRKGELEFGLPPAVNTKLVKRLRDSGAQIIIWSRGGEAHAEYAARFCGLDDIVTACLTKPDLIVDDGQLEQKRLPTLFVGPYDELRGRRFP